MSERINRRDLLRKGPLALLGIGAAAVLPEKQPTVIEAGDVPPGATIVINGDGSMIRDCSFTQAEGSNAPLIEAHSAEQPRNAWS